MTTRNRFSHAAMQAHAKIQSGADPCVQLRALALRYLEPMHKEVYDYLLLVPRSSAAELREHFGLSHPQVATYLKELHRLRLVARERVTENRTGFYRYWIC